jgi:hypothetical protein
VTSEQWAVSSGGKPAFLTLRYSKSRAALKESFAPVMCGALSSASERFNRSDSLDLAAE